MTISLKHTFTSAKTDSADATLVQPSNWNQEHVLTAAAGKVLGRDTSGAGAVQELPISVTSAGNVTIPNNFAVTGTTALTGALTLTNALAATSGGTGLTSPGASGNLLTSNGTTWTSVTPTAGSFLRVTVFTSSATWTKGAGTQYIRVRGVGGGGGGAYSSGGGGGGYFEEFIDVSATSTVSVTVGAAGARNATFTDPGSAGGTSSFGSFCSANGGGGGAFSGGGITDGGTASGGNINIQGQGANSFLANTNQGGSSGSSMLGFGAPFRRSSVTGTGFGAGGGGGGDQNSSNGADGTAGIVIVEEYS